MNNDINWFLKFQQTMSSFMCILHDAEISQNIITLYFVRALNFMFQSFWALFVSVDANQIGTFWGKFFGSGIADSGSIYLSAISSNGGVGREKDSFLQIYQT